MLEEHVTVRKVQAYTHRRSLIIVLPKGFTSEMGLGKGDFMKVQLKNRQLIMEKAEI
jgi:hypothetical protein